MTERIPNTQLCGLRPHKRPPRPPDDKKSKTNLSTKAKNRFRNLPTQTMAPGAENQEKIRKIRKLRQKMMIKPIHYDLLNPGSETPFKLWKPN